uniref:NADH-ubiquinone oxidoreductase chain 6 n=1 Tax=Jamesia sp. KM-2017 TaxID=2219643 RepID=A0A346RFD6_9CUCU|nr:NADH dehydrogenase subunit 6 [Jamesia sp. KM-2017]
MMIIMSLFLSITFPFLQHPLTLGLILLIQTIIIALMTGMMHLNFWFSYIMFLIMVGGMLILFIYMTSIASNEKFKLSSKLSLLIIPMMIMVIMTLFMDKFLTNMQIINYEISNQNTSNFYLTLVKFINWPLSMNFLLMIIYLLITLIMVVKITDIQYGPLRQKH